MVINHNQVVYIPKGEHDNPHELPKQQELEGSTETEHVLYSHADNIKYGLFKDVIDSYYLDSQITDDFTCDQNCYTKTQHKQQDQTITPCTHTYDYIIQYINNLEDPAQQHTVYTHEVDASLFTTDTTTACKYSITTDFTNSDNTHESKANIIQPMGIHSQSKHKYQNVFGNSNIQYHDFDNGDVLTFKDKYTALLQQELQNPYWCLHDPIATKSYQISSEMDIETMPHAMYFYQVTKRPSLRLIKSHTR